ncbi:MAG: HD domain-containing protein [Pseudomonadota bacterium]
MGPTTVDTEKAPMPLPLLDGKDTDPLVQTWFEIVHLKQLYRKGWLDRGIDPTRCETVAEHSFGNAMLCLLLVSKHPELNAEKVLRMALVHDLGEAYVGDITPSDNVPKSDKTAREHAALQRILGKLPNSEDLIATWLEYEQQSSPEATFVKRIDRLELALQAAVYEHQGLIEGQEFYQAVLPQLPPDLASLVQDLMTND